MTLSKQQKNKHLKASMSDILAFLISTTIKDIHSVTHIFENHIMTEQKKLKVLNLELFVTFPYILL